jgi:hypothetical protein
MDYEKIYNQLIDKAKLRKSKRDVYYERHHIIPKCMGGSNDKTNLVKLTAKEHFVAHKLLVEIYPDNGKLIHAYWRMANNKNEDKREYIVSSREYERLKTIHAKQVSINLKGTIKKWKNNQVRSKKIGNFHRGKVVSEGTRNRISVGLKEHYKKNINPNLGSKRTEETKQKLSKASKGRKHSEETKTKIKNLLIERGITGVPISDERKENIKKSIQKRKWINDGEVNKKIHPDDTIPDGWAVGRVISEDHRSKIKNVKIKIKSKVSKQVEEKINKFFG